MNKQEAIKRLEEIEQEKVKLEEIINKPERWYRLLTTKYKLK